ncbi:LacI family DNA-binding transcriptional regulator [Arthrobacter sp. StoSoilB5]|uniref:LacI family DNA-binding transcriptional regulator n=1 Tax=Arthrobacter sp. StoSoilB5 TaxID=2830992 RepID=UPI001CC6E18B|nr:LacI family DNA-binding transcriptional regulator [Arthrobacter sp. StoSoilB5]BCW44887.1 LacI family transcriptional regulator [Arthrobacter sp. StoSoilB5]
MAATLIDVARWAGVSVATASRVLNGSGNRRSKADIVERVRSAAQTLDYRPNATAQAVIRATSRLLGLVVPDVGDPYFSAIAKGAQEASARNGTLLLLSCIDGSTGGELRAFKALVSQRVEGIILAGSRCDGPGFREETLLLAAAAETYTRSGGRVVTVGEGILDNTSGAEIVLRIQEEERAAELASALAVRGCSSFTIVAGPELVRQSDRRVSGFIRGLRESGAPTANVIRGEMNRSGGLKAGEEVLRNIRDQQYGMRHGVLSVNDRVAMGFISTLSAAGYESPRDYAIGGFDDIPQVKDFWPRLSTVRLPLQKIGARAAEMSLGDDVDCVLKGEVMLRASTTDPVKSIGKA